MYCQDYSFHGFNINYTGVTNIDYDRVFCFCDLNQEDLLNWGKFEYSIIHGTSEKIFKGPFQFESEIYNDEKSDHTIITYGDTDATEKGIKTINRMKTEKYDLLVLLGDYAYDIFQKNGKKGDNFFELMEPVFTKAPFVLTPGNHEIADDARFLNSRFIMPGNPKWDHDAMNLFYFVAAKTLWISMNLDFTDFLEMSRVKYYSEKLFSILSEMSPKRGTQFEYIAFFTHRPFYCVQRGERSIIDNYYVAPIEAILNTFDVDMIMTGHTHDFERNTMFFEYLPAKNAENKVMIISGAAGTDKDPLDSDRYYNMSFSQRYIPEVNGIVEMNITSRNVHFKFFKVEDRFTLYEFDLRQSSFFGSSLFWFGVTMFAVMAVAVGLVMLIVKSLYSKKSDMDEIGQENDRGESLQADPVEDS